MKKVLTCLLAICLVFTLCISSFAAPDLSGLSGVLDQIKGVVSGLGDTPSPDAVKAAATEIITAIQSNGADTKTDFIQAADALYENGIISEDVYNEIYKLVESGDYDITQVDVDDALSQITAIAKDDTKTSEEKAQAIINVLSGFSSEQIQTMVDSLHTAGIVDDDLYNKISDGLNSGSAGGGITLPSGTPDTSGIQDFFSGLLAQLGLGGGTSDDGSTTTNNSSGSFEGANAKTGDYAVVSVAGVALVAGIALVLTKKKK